MSATATKTPAKALPASTPAGDTPRAPEGSLDVFLTRRGRFRVAGVMLRRNPEDVLRAVLSRVLVTRAEFDFGTDAMMYEGCSQHFDRADRGGLAPTYEFQLQTVNGESTFLRCERTSR